MNLVRDGLSGGNGVAGVIQGSPPAHRLLRCPECDSNATIMLGDDQAQCEDCGSIFVVPRNKGVQYQRTGNTVIRPILFNTDICAFDLARAWYEQYRNDPDPAKRLDFEFDLLDYMKTGYVCIRPKLFALAKVVEHEGERMWFIRIAIGDLIELLQVLPFPLPKMCFCRENQPDSMRVISVLRLAQIAVRQARKGEAWAAAAA